MARRNEYVYALNAGGVDKQALGRVDLEKMRLAGEHPVKNWLPKVVGPMALRPGLEYKATLAAVTRDIPFIRSRSVKNILAFSDVSCTICEDGVPITVLAPATTITNPSFTSGGGGWSDVSDTGDGTDGTATLGVSGGLALLATRWRAAAAQQAVSVAGSDQATRHTLRIVVARGPVYFRIGSSSGGEEIFAETRLLTGTHKLSFTPGTGTIYLRFRSEDRCVRAVNSCTFEHTILGGTGPLTLPTPWNEDDLPFLAWDQSADVMFIADGQVKPRRIERRGTHSWSITDYDTRNGVIELPAQTRISLTPSTLSGNGTLTANRAYFKPSHVGSLFELTHNEQRVIDELNAAGQYTDYITVRGLFSSSVVFNDRNWGLTIDMTTGSFTGVIALYRSTDPEAAIWTEVAEYNTDTATTYNDEQSNLLAHYRFGVKSYTSGYANVSLIQAAGSTTGLIRVTEYSSATSVNIEVVNPLGDTKATLDWRAPAWSDDLGWPRVPRLFDGRLWWFRGDVAYGSIVDDFDNFDDTVEGDSGPVVRSIGNASAEGALWALDMQRLIVGTTGFEASIRSSSFDEPITPTQFTVRNASTIGSALIPAVKLDRGAFFVSGNRRRLYELAFTGETNDYSSLDVTRLVPSALAARVKSMAVQRQPDARVYMVLYDGTCVVMTFERDDKVVAFTTIETAGAIEDVCILPGTEQDDVYFITTRYGVRLREKMANEREQESVATCALLDGHAVLTGSVSAISGATRFNGQTVQVWADGRRRADVTISAGAAALGQTYARVVYGVRHTAEFLSSKLAYAAQLGSAVGQTKIVRGASLILANSCLDGIRLGKDATNTDPMPAFVDGAQRTANQFFATYDEDIFPIPSSWDTDARLYISADSAEGPVTVQAVVLDIETREGVSEARNK